VEKIEVMRKYAGRESRVGKNHRKQQTEKRECPRFKEKMKALSGSLLEERVHVHRVPDLHIRSGLLVVRMQIGREEFVVVHDMKKVHGRILCLVRRVAATSDTRAGAVRGVVACRRVILSRSLRNISYIVLQVGRRNEGRVPERL
jgi:hypothetical protein